MDSKYFRGCEWLDEGGGCWTPGGIWGHDPWGHAKTIFALSDMSNSNSKSYYKDLYSELKQDLKRKKRELEDADDRLRRCEAESKKAKIESQEILKLYHGLQRELQLAYERNAKLQVDKVSFEALLDSERKDFESFKRQQTTSMDENKKLKDALCSMKMEKLELETKFNAIVMENKDLRDRARQYEPRLRELDEIKRRLAQMEQLVNDQLKPEIQAQNERARTAQLEQELVDRYAKWNDLLQKELREKSREVQRYDELVEYARRLEEEKAQPSGNDSSEDTQRFPDLLQRVAEIRASMADLKRDVRQEVADFTSHLFSAIDRLKRFQQAPENA